MVRQTSSRIKCSFVFMTTVLSKKVLIMAYSQGFFPMPHPETGEICWFNPDPRAVIPLDNFHLSRSLRRTIKRGHFKVTIDCDFTGVLKGCASRDETWINDEIQSIYTEMFVSGLAHSVEVWNDGTLVGGLYGIALGSAFFAESKFHTETDASKVALFALVQTLRKIGGKLLEVQFMTRHLATLGAKEISSEKYLSELALSLQSSVQYPRGAISLTLP